MTDHITGKRPDSDLPLSGVQVADLSDGSNAFCAALLADLGATVSRGGAPSPDVVIISGTPSALAQSGRDPARLVAAAPQLIVAVVSPFGLQGPRAEWATCDTVAQALGGMLHVNGYADEPPLRGLGPQAHNSAALHAAIGIAIALLARREHGRGQLIDVSEQESTVAMLEHVTGLFHERGVVAERRGTLHWSGTFAVVRCADGPVLLSHVGDWTALLEWLKHDGAAADLAEPRWEDPALRSAECAHVFGVLAAWAARYRVAELVTQAQLRRLPFAPVWPLGEVAMHPQLWARRFFVVRDGIPAIRRGGPFRFQLEGGASSPPEGSGEGEVADHRPAHPKAAASRRTPQRVLHGIRVLDFTWVVAGPLATRVLADHGAEVIKVERPDTPDAPARRGGLFGNLNRGKRSIAIDLRAPGGVGLARALAERSDIVIDNFSPRVLSNWGLSHATLRAADARLITLSLSGFGATGPLADAVSYGPTLHAHTGCTWHMRHLGGAPAGWGFAFSDMASGYCAALAVLAALWRRTRSGRGCAIDLSQLECLATMIGAPLAAAQRGEWIPDAAGNRSPDHVAAPDGVYRCADGVDGRERWCAVSVTDDAWPRFVATIGAPTWISDARFATQASRTFHADALDRCVESWTRARTAEEVMSALQAAGIAAGVVADARDLAADPQLAAREYWSQCADGSVVDGVVPRLAETPGAVTAPGPLLGEHTDEILRDVLGMKQSAVDRLRRDRVIR